MISSSSLWFTLETFFKQHRHLLGPGVYTAVYMYDWPTSNPVLYIVLSFPYKHIVLLVVMTIDHAHSPLCSTLRAPAQ